MIDITNLCPIRPYIHPLKFLQKVKYTDIPYLLTCDISMSLNIEVVITKTSTDMYNLEGITTAFHGRNYMFGTVL